MRKHHFYVIGAILIMALFIAGCNGQDTTAPDVKPNDSASTNTNDQVTVEKPLTFSNEPVTLRMLDLFSRLTEDNFHLLVAEPVKKVYPNITVEYVQAKLADLEQLTVTGEQMDLVLYWNGEISMFLKFDLLTDLNPLVKNYNFDLTRYQDNMLEPNIGNKGELYGLPYYKQGDTLYYNKDLFDKFGVDYPADGLFWEDIVELTKRLYRIEDGVTYYGYNYEAEYRLHSPLSLGLTNETDRKALVNTDDWAKVLRMMKTLRVDAQGGGQRKTVVVEFMNERNLAMFGSVTSRIQQIKELEKDGLNWDMAQFPSWKERPDVSGFADLGVIGILKTTKHQEAAWQVVDTFLKDDVQQTMVSHAALISPFKGQQFIDQFAKSMPELQTKRLDAIFKSKTAPFPEHGLGEYYINARNMLRKHINQYLDNAVDVNTALRNAEEEINIFLSEIGK